MSLGLFGELAFAVVLVPRLGDIVSMECLSSEGRLRCVDRHEKVRRRRTFQLVSLKEFFEVEVRDRPRHLREVDFFRLLEQINAVSIRNHWDVRRTI
jgi:hypothetical protein